MFANEDQINLPIHIKFSYKRISIHAFWRIQIRYIYYTHIHNVQCYNKLSIQLCPLAFLYLCLSDQPTEHRPCFRALERNFHVCVYQRSDTIISNIQSYICFYMVCIKIILHGVYKDYYNITYLDHTNSRMPFISFT